jgi:hypothetical protein
MKPMESGVSPSPCIGAANAGLRFSHLSSTRQALVRLCQNINYGSIQALCVNDGEPVLTPPPEVFVDVKLDADEPPRPEVDLPDFEVCGQVCRLIRELHELGTGIIEHIEIRGGIARRIVFRGAPTKARPFVPQTALPDEAASDELGSKSGELL